VCQLLEVVGWWGDGGVHGSVCMVKHRCGHRYFVMKRFLLYCLYKQDLDELMFIG